MRQTEVSHEPYQLLISRSEIIFDIYTEMWAEILSPIQYLSSELPTPTSNFCSSD